MFKKLVLLVSLTVSSMGAYASETGECLQKGNIYGYSVTYWPDSDTVTLSLGKYGRAHYFVHYNLIKVTHDAGGHKEFYEVDRELGSPFPPFRAWPTSFEMDFFTRIANQPQVKLYLIDGLPIYMECNF